MGRYGPYRHGKRPSRNAPCRPPPRRKLTLVIAVAEFAPAVGPRPPTRSPTDGSRRVFTRRLSRLSGSHFSAMHQRQNGLASANCANARLAAAIAVLTRAFSRSVSDPAAKARFG